MLLIAEASATLDCTGLEGLTLSFRFRTCQMSIYSQVSVLKFVGIFYLPILIAYQRIVHSYEEC
jgi:hypothetical protein